MCRTLINLELLMLVLMLLELILPLMLMCHCVQAVVVQCRDNKAVMALAHQQLGGAHTFRRHATPGPLRTICTIHSLGPEPIHTRRLWQVTLCNVMTSVALQAAWCACAVGINTALTLCTAGCPYPLPLAHIRLCTRSHHKEIAWHTWHTAH